MNPGNADLIRQKQKLLTQFVSETKTKLDALRQARKKLDKEGLTRPMLTTDVFSVRFSKPKTS